MSRRGVSTEQVRASLWFWPSVAAVGFVAVALSLLRYRPDPTSTVAEWTWPGQTSSATGVLQTVATSSMTAISLTFSLTVVALQLASQQFSPRLLRSFARDWLVQATMAVLVSAFAASVITLRAIDPERPLPVLAVLLCLLLGLASAGFLIAFVSHIVRRLRVDNMMRSVHEDTITSMYTAYAAHGEGPDLPGERLPGPLGGVLVPAWRSGFVRAIDPGPLVETARRHRVFLRLSVRPGDAVVKGAPVASVFPLEGAADGADAGDHVGVDGDVDVDGIARAMAEAVSLGFERTEEQDVSFGLRQLVDIAIKAISPAVNDPTTAAEALGYCADVLTHLEGRRLGAQVQRDDDGTAWVVLPDRDLHYYLDLTCAQPRRFGREEPTVLTAVLRLLRDAAACARDDEQRRLVAEQSRLVLAQMSDSMLEVDADSVRDMARRVDLALAGEVERAYADEAGETRSI